MNERLTAANLLCTYQYAVNLNVPNESDSARRDMWRYRSEKLTVNNETVWERNRASKTTYDPYVGLLMLEPNEELAEVRTEIYVLFLLCLALHPDAPGIFAVDSFDHSMHPRLARETTRLFCKTILEQDKTVFVTTHNPLVLDGLDLMDDDIRLFAVNKSRKSSHTTLQRIQITKELMDSGYSLSRLWTEGRLGGVPNL